MNKCFCGNPTKRSRTKTCSRACYLLKRYGEPRKITRICICGKKFQTWPIRIKKSGAKYCSTKCFHENYKRRSGLKYKTKVENKGAFKPTHNYHCWKEEYQAVHIWIRRHKTKPLECKFCGELKPLDWANISKKYKRDINDWIALCRKCHWNYDHREVII